MCWCCTQRDMELIQTSRGSVDLNISNMQIEMEDWIDNKTYKLLDLNYCPICGTSLKKTSLDVEGSYV